MARICGIKVDEDYWGTWNWRGYPGEEPAVADCVECKEPQHHAEARCLDGKVRCLPCWQGKTRLERVLLGWEKDPYDGRERRRVGDKRVTSFMVNEQYNHGLEVPTPIEPQMDIMYEDYV